MKLLIKNGKLVDPINGTLSLTDVMVENGKIAQVEKGIEGQTKGFGSVLYMMNSHLRNQAGN